ncbi:hypothetical protein F4820DRAFT_445731 [Hypoxylon rubiginosum]|uniref:Uncharacterized protein n=1 Tax=Hypoxylon rubiginosum TaxID=110542 RepID=A0ACB9Z9D1_9PEZI|nr:hypothetical protein F4820DRAFT_445731 [Hypoxylon rubiginosum]
MSQLPAGTLGDAVGVLLFTFICLFTNILLVWLYCAINEPWHYVALIGYFAILCTTSSIIQQIYNYTLWNDLLWAQLSYIKANYENADVVFNNGNFGFMRVLAIIRLFCYIVESTYLLAYCIHVRPIPIGFWQARRKPEKISTIVGIVAPIIGAAITIGLLQTAAVQRSFIAYLIVANVQSVLSCLISIVLIFLITVTFIRSKLAWRRLRPSSGPSGSWPRWRNENRAEGRPAPRSAYAAQGVIFDDNWLVIRLSVAVVLITGFILANIVTHLPQRDDILRDAQASEPDLSAARARSNIIGYIFGVTPGLAIFIVFGLGGAFRQVMYDRLMPRRWRRIFSNKTRTRESTLEGGVSLENIPPRARERSSSGSGVALLYSPSVTSPSIATDKPVASRRDSFAD